jgi:hypothetical protein
VRRCLEPNENLGCATSGDGLFAAHDGSGTSALPFGVYTRRKLSNVMHARLDECSDELKELPDSIRFIARGKALRCWKGTLCYLVLKTGAGRGDAVTEIGC